MSRTHIFAIAVLAVYVVESFVMFPFEEGPQVDALEAEAKSPYCISGYCRFPNRCCPGYVCRFNLFAPYFQGICARKVNFLDLLGTGKNKTEEQHQSTSLPVSTPTSVPAPAASPSAVVVTGSTGTTNTTAARPPAGSSPATGPAVAAAGTTNGTSTGSGVPASAPASTTVPPARPPAAPPSGGTPVNAPDRPVGVTQSPTAVNSGQTNATLPAISSSNAGSAAPNATSPPASNATANISSSTTPVPTTQPTMLQPSLLGPVKPAGVWSLGPLVISVGFSKNCFDKWFEKLSWFNRTL